MYVVDSRPRWIRVNCAVSNSGRSESCVASCKAEDAARSRAASRTPNASSTATAAANRIVAKTCVHWVNLARE